MSVTLDSQCVTYLIDALTGMEKPERDLAEEKISLVQIFFYVASHYETTPEVVVEVNKISEPLKLATHLSWIRTHFAPREFWKDGQREIVRSRYKEFYPIHKKEADCRILAQAEALEFSTLLSYDLAFVDNLSSRTNINLLKPSEHWQSCRVERGAELKVGPHFSSPLLAKDWWRI